MPINAADAIYRTGKARQHGAMEYTEPPTDLDAVRMYRLGRRRAVLVARS